jgi:hypothetical protein
MPQRTPVLALLFLLLFSHCGKTQDTDQSARAAAAKDSIARVKERAANRERYLAVLDQTQVMMHKTEGMDDAQRLIHAEYGTCKTLTILIRSLDSSAIVHKEVREEEMRLLHEDSTRGGAAGKIVNGMTGIYSLYGLLYKMRFGQDTAGLAMYDRIHDDVIKKMRREVQAIEAVAAMARGVYEMSSAIVRDIDKDSLYAGQFALVAQQNDEGMHNAETDEDRFLNGIYRTFEVCQLWALYLDPTNKEEVSHLLREMFTMSKKAEGVGAQLAVGMEYLYKIHDLIARRSIHLSY